MKRTQLVFTFLFCTAFIQSCAPKIPAQSVSLMQQIAEEGQRMHKLNTAFVNQIFTDKTEAINNFVENEYLPSLMDNIKKIIAEKKLDMNSEWPDMVKSLTPKLNSYRDSLQNSLSDGKIKIITKLNDDYSLFKQACDAQYNLLSSAVKLNETNKMVLNNLAQKLSKGTINADKIQQMLDRFLQKGSGAAGIILNLQNDINNIIKP